MKIYDNIACEVVIDQTNINSILRFLNWYAEFIYEVKEATKVITK